MGCSSDKSTRAVAPKKTSSGTLLQNVPVSPDIFVSLKDGQISSYYRIGEVIGEGSIDIIVKR
jgi:hypothetical protein